MSEARARKTRTPRFTDFFTDFEKKTYCVAVYHILSILLIGSDTASRVAEAMIGAKVRILCVRVFLLCFSNLGLELVPGSLGFSHLGNRAKICDINPRRNSSR